MDRGQPGSDWPMSGLERITDSKFGIAPRLMVPPADIAGSRSVPSSAVRIAYLSLDSYAPGPVGFSIAPPLSTQSLKAPTLYTWPNPMSLSTLAASAERPPDAQYRMTVLFLSKFLSW